MEKITFKYYKFQYSPIIKNLLRSVFLPFHIYVEFEMEKIDFIIEYKNKIIKLESNKLEFLKNSLRAYQGKLEEEILNLVYEICNPIIRQIKNDIADDLQKDLIIHYIQYISENSIPYYNAVPPSSAIEIEIERKWKNTYGYIGEFKLLNNHKINKINSKEVSVYQELFSKIPEGAESIDNAIDSLLASIPEEIERILDIGSGPGYVDAAIPFYYNVLAMDIDEQILQYNKRQTCIGDILDIPLANKDVDLSIACDVLEHISTENLEQAFCELQRVSRKYIYIQIPYKENLPQGTALCKNCGYKWHINYHKNSFSLNQIRSYFSKEWTIKIINFTGEVTNYKKENEIYEFLSKNNIEANNIEEWKCPKCNGFATIHNKDYINILKDIYCINKYKERIYPSYSELGVLFEYKSAGNAIPIILENTININSNSLLYNNLTDFSNLINEAKYFTQLEQVPTLFLGNCIYERQQAGYLFKKNSDDTKFWFAISFPFYETDNNKVYIKGKCFQNCNIDICFIDYEKKEILLDSVNITMGEFFVKQLLPINIINSNIFIKLYFDTDQIVMNKIYIKQKASQSYRSYFNTTSSKSYITQQFDEIDTRWLIPSNNHININIEWIEWLDNINGSNCITTEDVLKHALKTQAVLKKVYQNNEENTIKYNEINLRKYKAQIKFLESLFEEQTYFYILKEEEYKKKLLLLCSQQENIYFLKNKKMKNILVLYKNKTKKILYKIIGFLKRNSILFSFLDTIGLRKLYNKIKNRYKE